MLLRDNSWLGHPRKSNRILLVFIVNVSDGGIFPYYLGPNYISGFERFVNLDLILLRRPNILYPDHALPLCLQNCIANLLNDYNGLLWHEPHHARQHSVADIWQNLSLAAAPDDGNCR